MKLDFAERSARSLCALHPALGADPAPVVDLLMACATRRVPAGGAVCREGEPSDRLIFVLLGRIWVLREDHRGQARELATLESPQVVGHVGVITGGARTATCLAARDTIVAEMDRGLWSATLHAPTPAGQALRLMTLSSLTCQLAAGNAHLTRLLAGEDGEDSDTVDSAAVLQARVLLQGYDDAEPSTIPPIFMDPDRR